MSGTDWVCDSCEANNLAADTNCHLCQRQQGSITGTVKPVSYQAPPDRNDVRPRFVESKHVPARDVEHHTIVMVPTPPTVRPTPPKVRPTPPKPTPSWPVHVPPVRGRRRRAGRWAVLCILVLGVFAIIVVASQHGLSNLSNAQQPATSSAQPSGTACPDNVAQWLPNGSTGAVLVAQYETDEHIVTICQDTTTGQYYYDGQQRNAPVNNDTHICLPATRTSTGFVAVNNGYQYEINGSELILTFNGTFVKEWGLTQIGS
jgi:hypothetical protein